MNPLRLAQWLFCPAVSVAAHWCLVLEPERVLAVVPQLWALPASKTATTTRKTSVFEDLATGDFDADKLIAELWADFEAQLTVYDYAAMIIITAAMWTSLVGMAWLAIPPFRSLVRWLCSMLWWLLQTAMSFHCHEVLVYLLAFAVSAQSCRYPSEAQQEDSIGELIGFLAGLAFIPCWAVSTLLHGASAGVCGSWLLFQAVVVGGPAFALQLAGLAWLHNSQVIGLLAVFAAYCAVSCVLCWVRMGEPGFDLGLVGQSCSIASLAVPIITLIVRKVAGPQLAPHLLQPFIGGLALCGHIAFLASAVVLSSRWRKCESNITVRNCWVLFCLLAYLVVGHVFNIKALSGTASTFTILWILQKEFEFDLNLGVKLLAGSLILQYLRAQVGSIEAMFDPTNLYD